MLSGAGSRQAREVSLSDFEGHHAGSHRHAGSHVYSTDPCAQPKQGLCVLHRSGLTGYHVERGRTRHRRERDRCAFCFTAHAAQQLPSRASQGPLRQRWRRLHLPRCLCRSSNLSSMQEYASVLPRCNHYYPLRTWCPMTFCSVSGPSSASAPSCLSNSSA